ncbi:MULTISPECIES: Rne/Rng family ribonuclease [Moraxella]|uniref:Ribonuclease G n=1 Tax=Moraxella lacunata TaxID=477 RepID=A0A1B8PZE5_MORLA|nr:MULTISPECIES: Rne/Rng family ribonuclease [Moraxella]MBE9578207.1 Rne/Rng family ribonuclease [Moraxella sp. K1664]MBE9588116.1 Rne/Rng family ribonuclease [Moraxella sp. K1630]MBE9589808.1 Rne/Rng family ribonuclease [Moraxella sp. K127]MBE9596232.1 Rne/Rng family ribonuclease [Moraxella sp. K2450]MDI4482737.1 Rne/Rng family ribonuclease [Moraxella lacunata]
MSKHALINATPFETRLVIVDDGRLDEVFIERVQARSLVGDVYLGTVVRVLPAMGSVFIDIGRERSAFLHQSDIMLPTRPSSQDDVATPTPITTLPMAHQVGDKSPTQSQPRPKPKPAKPKLDPKLLPKLLPKVGERVVIQVTKDEFGTKGVRVTMHIALAGRYLVYLPTSPQSVGVSTRIGTKAYRTKLKAHLTTLLSQSSHAGGLIARSACEQALGGDETLADMGERMQAELDHLGALWVDISQARTQASLHKAKHALLYQELPLAERALRDIITDDIQSVWIDDRATYERVRHASCMLMPSITSAIYHHDKPTPLFAQSVPDECRSPKPDIETQLTHALSRHCPLPSGGYLIIEYTEAMTTIDVNTGSYVGQGRAGVDVVYETNKEAVTAIARELKVRNIGGIIILDFIDMDKSAHQQAVLDMLAHALKADPATTNITQISELGLVEMTRKRTRPSLSDELCEPCPACHGTGKIKSVQTVAFEILRSLMGQLANSTSFKKPNVTIKVSQLVADYLSSHQDLSNLQKLTNTSIHLSINTSYHQEQYAILVE